jgi:hypothetical protein
MASQPISHTKPQPEAPYCSDPNCQSCKELRKVQDAIRLNQPIRILEITSGFRNGANTRYGHFRETDPVKR